jgi:IS1 family transposase
MNILPQSKQVEIIGMLCEGVGQRAASRLTGTDRKTVARLALAIGNGCAELHDRIMVGLRVYRIECDELWAYVGHKRNPQKSKPRKSPAFGDQYTYVALASATRAIIGYRTGKRDGATTDDFIQDLRGRVIGAPEISTDGLHYYRPAIRDAFGKRAVHGVINKTYSVTHLNVTEASRRYSPAAVVAVERVAVEGEPEDISTSYVERQNLTLRMASKRFARLSNGFSKKIDCHLAAVSLYVAFYNLCKSHESLSPSAKTPVTPAMALGIADHPWTVGELIDAALKAVPPKPTPTPAQRRKSFRVIQGDLSD